MWHRGSGSAWRLAGALLLVALVASLVSCGRQFQVEEFSSQRLDVSGISRVQVETFNGAIEVGAGKESPAQIDVTRRGSGVTQAQAQDALRNVEVQITQEGSTLRVIASKTNPDLVGGAGASFRVWVPADTPLDLKSSNGQVTTGDMTGEVRIRTSNGLISVTGGKGSIDVATSNGEIKIQASDAILKASTSNGAVSFQGSFAEGSQSIQTSNGAVIVALPTQARFSFDASTSHGLVTSEFALSKSGASTQSSLSGTVGENPSTSVVVRSSNGSVAFRKGS